MIHSRRELHKFGAVEPIGCTADNAPIEIEGRTYRDRTDRTLANFEQVTPGFFSVTAQKLVDGRGFSADDNDQHQPVAVVNAAFAGKHFPREQAIGRRFRTTSPDGSRPGVWRTIVGVVSTVRMLGPFNNPGPWDRKAVGVRVGHEDSAIGKILASSPRIPS